MRWLRVQLLFFIILLVTAVAIFQTHTRSSKAAFSQAVETSDFEDEVVNEINAVRIEPTSAVSYLEKRETLFRGLIMYPPKQTPFLTNEGFPAVEEAIAFLNKAPKAQSLRISNGLVKVAKAQLADLLEKPELGHFGKDGSDLS